MKVSELEGAELDCWVSRANGNKAKISDDGTFAISRGSRYSPSVDWRFGGPIVERERINLYFEFDPALPQIWHALSHSKPLITASRGIGSSPLVAAMRCYVDSKFGEEVAEE
jgi:hypothetical protein